MKSYEEGMQVYHSIKTGRRRQYATPVPRTEIELYQKGFESGFIWGRDSVKIEIGQNLFNALRNLDIIPLESEMQEVIDAVKTDNNLR